MTGTDDEQVEQLGVEIADWQRHSDLLVKKTAEVAKRLDELTATSQDLAQRSERAIRNQDRR
jgi:hypothetical protein